MNDELVVAEVVAEAVDCWIRCVDACCHCGDIECDGIGCITNLDPDNEADHPAIEELHELLRQGQAWRFLIAQLRAGMELPDAFRHTRWLLSNANNQMEPCDGL